jgi:Flp pilus assembly protein TadB
MEMCMGKPAKARKRLRRAMDRRREAEDQAAREARLDVLLRVVWCLIIAGAFVLWGWPALVVAVLADNAAG